MFRPCIDIHDGQVKQIVGGTLTDKSPAGGGGGGGTAPGMGRQAGRQAVTATPTPTLCPPALQSTLPRCTLG